MDKVWIAVLLIGVYLLTAFAIAASVWRAQHFFGKDWKQMIPWLGRYENLYRICYLLIVIAVAWCADVAWPLVLAMGAVPVCANFALVCMITKLLDGIAISLCGAVCLLIYYVWEVNWVGIIGLVALFWIITAVIALKTENKTQNND